MLARRLWTFVRPQWPLVAGSLVTLALATAAQLAVPPLAASAFTDLTRLSAASTAGDRAAALDHLNQLGLALLGLFAMNAALQYGYVRLTHLVSQRVASEIRLRLFERIQSWSLDEVRRWQTGDLISRVLLDTDTIRYGLLIGLADAAGMALYLLGVGVAVIVLDWRLTVVAAAMVAASVLVARAVGPRIQAVMRDAQARVADLAGMVRRAATGAGVIRAFGQEAREVAAFRRASRTWLDASVRVASTTAAAVPLMSLPVPLAVLVVIWVGGQLVASGTLTVGGVIMFLMYLVLAQQPASGISRQYAQVRQAAATLERLVQVLDRPAEVPDDASLATMPRIRGEIVFDRVSLEYEPGLPALREVSLRIAPGEHVAIVGPSGAGKTSLAALVPRFRDPTAGRVLVDGRDLRTVSPRSVRAQIGLVQQEVILFGESVRANIAFGRPEATDQDVVAAARAARAHEFIERLPAGYDTVLAEDALDLSGGQRQRLAIARALLVDPRIIILDEATSSLDAESEALIQEALATLMRGRTTIVIAHRLSTVQSADRILVLQEGRVIEEGSHRDLIGRDGLYSRLSQWQVVADLPEVGP